MRLHVNNVQFQNFPGEHVPGCPLVSLLLLSESGLALIYAACYALFDEYENFFLEP